MHWIFAILVLSFGVCLLCMRSGIEIDIKNKQIRKYSAFANYKFGVWFDLKSYVHVELRHTSESQTMHSRVSSATIRTKTYDLVFSKENSKEDEFNDFTDYKIASQVFKIAASSFGSILNKPPP